MSEYTNVRIAIEDRVAILTIDHPPANVFNRAPSRTWTRRWMS